MADEKADDVVLTLKLKPTPERMSGLSVGIYRRVGTSPDAQARYIAHFMVNGKGEYMAEDDALAVLDALTVKQLGQAMRQLRQLVEAAAVPNG